ncbi:MAG: metal-sensing transcriptional repressor [Candidatus Izemoplasmatales bacterium]|nr:metal-sensing transcriptional repressor [Candidatus Izemoplasmatales bacterium]
MLCEPSLKNRIKRAQGQMQGVLKMMDNESTCMDILTQLKAIRSSIDKAIGILTTTNLIQQIEKSNDIKLNNIEEALELVIKGIK